MSILGSIIGSVVKDKSTGKAKDALIDAAGQAQTAQVGAANSVIGLNAPGVDLYGRATNALSQRAGLGGNLGSANLPTQGVASSAGAPTGDLTGMSAYEAGYGAGGNALSTGGGGAPALSPGSYGDLSNPTLNTPNAPTLAPLDVSAGAFQESPGFQYALQRGMGAVNADFASRGALNSGAAAKALTGVATGLAQQDYGNWRDDTTAQYNADRSSALGQFNADRNYGADRYDTDRGYLTDQYNTQTGDLRSLANGGAGAVQTTGNALTQIGTAGAQAATNIGNARAGSALQKGNIWSGAAADIDGQLQSAATKFLPF